MSFKPEKHRSSGGGRPGYRWSTEEDNILREVHEKRNGRYGWQKYALQHLQLLGYKLSPDQIRRRAEVLELTADKSNSIQQKSAAVVRKEQSQINRMLRLPWHRMHEVL